MQNTNKLKYLLAFGHMCSDINQGALAAVLPFLIAAYHYDYQTAATLVLVSNVIGSVIQPIFGNLADKYNKPYLIAVGLVLAGGGMALTGFIENFYGLCLAVMISGVGIAMFHPQAAQLINRASTDSNRAQSISVFSFGGNLGFSFGPILTTISITTFGMAGTLIFIVPEIIICILLKKYYNDLKNLNRTKISKVGSKGAGVDNWSAFFRLTAVVIGRSIIFHGFNTFLALYWIHELGQTETIGNTVLSAYYAISAACVLIGGKLADSFGYRTMIKISFAILLVTIIALANSESLFVSTILILPLGAAISFTYSPMVVLGQLYLPNRVGLASGVTLGLAISMGGIFAPILGAVADNFGLLTTIYVIAGIAILPLAVAFTLPPVGGKNFGK